MPVFVVSMDTITTQPAVVFDSDLIRRYDRQGPRYTSYPTAVQFDQHFGERDYIRQAERSNAFPRSAPLSLYVHIPFCATVCYYCACSKVITKNRLHAAHYLRHLFTEIARQGELFDRARRVEQLHWGGGSPTFLAREEMSALMDALRRHFTLHEDDAGEYSIEVDPRTVVADDMAALRALGFNRLSLGVQDFDAEVQAAVNRIQPESQTLAILGAARAAGFRSISIDLIYGLPRQTLASFDATLGKVIAAAPDRISLFNYAHLPHLFKVQRQIDARELPAAEEKLAILARAIDRLTAAGYVHIGMDHFARPEDELALAQRRGQLSRNFQGYSTHGDCDIVGLGVTAIGRVGNCYSQNEKELRRYEERIAQTGLAVQRGVELTADDVLRRTVIMQLICHFTLDVREIEARHGIRFEEYFAGELRDLEVMHHDGLLDYDGSTLAVRPAGRLLIRNICMVFDRYLRGASEPAGRYSRVL